jgi:hypothetical protein
MNQLSSGYCLGCGKELSDTPAFHGKTYRVCGQCADIMQQGNHKDFFKVMKAVSKNLDSARTEHRFSTKPEHFDSAWINAIGL